MAGGGEETGEMGEGGQNVQTSGYKITKSWGCNVQYNDCIAYLKSVKRVDLKSSHHKTKKL